MEDTFMEKVSTEELNRISQEAAELQAEYSIRRIIVNRELARRAAMIEIIAPEQEIKSAPIYPPSNPPVHNHGSEEGRGLECGERIVENKLRGWCMDGVTEPRGSK